jgi:hypothetical protein
MNWSKNTLEASRLVDDIESVTYEKFDTDIRATLRTKS